MEPRIMPPRHRSPIAHLIPDQNYPVISNRNSPCVARAVMAHVSSSFGPLIPYWVSENRINTALLMGHFLISIGTAGNTDVSLSLLGAGGQQQRPWPSACAACARAVSAAHLAQHCSRGCL
jgi:hypothetical protein